VTKPTMDAERLAALLDGRLSGADREALLAELADSDEGLEVLADAIAVSEDVSADADDADDDSDAAVVRLRPRVRPAVWRAALAVAAALALLLAAPWMMERFRAAEPAGPAQVAMLLADAPAQMPDDWNRRPWTATRGAEDPLTPQARSVRLGAVLLELEVAVRAGDQGAARLAEEAALLLGGFPGAGPAASIYRAVARHAIDAPAEAAALLPEGEAAALAIADAERVRIGAWLQGARMAAARRDAAFFRTRSSGAALDRLEVFTAAGGDPERVQSIRRALDAEDAPDWTTIGAATTDLLARLGS
jgi:hypothetical protein